MTTLYKSQRQSGVKAAHHRSFMHHAAWGILCALLFAVLAGLWVNNQSQKAQISELRKQLSIAHSQSLTCKVTGNWKKNTTKQLSLAAPSGVRSYLVHTPKDFDDTTYFPLIMFYSGRGASAMSVEASYGLNNLPAILVYPFPSQGKAGDLAWQSAPYSSGVDDVSFTASILDKLQDILCIDKTRIYATGMSNGGGFASLLSCELPDRFAAYAIVGGALYSPDSDCKPPRPAPIISIHGDNDGIVPYDGSITRGLPPIYTWSAKRASLEDCEKPTTSYISALAIATTWTGCRGGSEIRSIRIVGGKHEWGQISNESLWQFLSRFSL